MKKFSLALVAGLFAAGANAAPFAANADIYTGTGYSSSYVGNNSALGYVIDGGFDAFDGFGTIGSRPSGVSVSRKVNLLAGQNIYRWVDTFTNTTASAISGQAVFQGNLGSDSSTFVTTSNSYYKISRDNLSGSSYDPVLALVNGNNAWSVLNTNAQITGDNYKDFISLSLAAGQSISVAHFAILVRPNNTSAYFNPTQSVALATQQAQTLVGDPSAYWAGLTQSEIGRIANFAQPVPEPETYAMMMAGLGLLGFMGRRRQKAAA